MYVLELNLSESWFSKVFIAVKYLDSNLSQRYKLYIHDELRKDVADASTVHVNKAFEEKAQ